jgi:hypothetical protein
VKEYSSLSQTDITRKTYHCDLARGGFEGMLSTGSQTFCLFIAIRYFQADENLKSLIAAAPFMGMFLSVILLHYAEGTKFRKSSWGAVPSVITGVFLLLAASTTQAEWFALFVVVAYIGRSALLPFLTDIYGDNYPAHLRGHYFSRPLILTVAISAGFGYAGSLFLENNIENFTWLFALLGFSAFAKAISIYRMPSKIMEKHTHQNPLSNFKYIFEDRSFGYVLLTWFIMGFANLWTIPLRVDYVTSAEYGIEGSAIFVAFIITIIPDTMRMLFIPFWAKLFDRMNFVALRMLLNFLFAIGVAAFFISKNPWVIGMGSALIGIAFAGGSIAWNLWVTKYAPPGKTAAYMSVHVSLTGIRGTIGPVIGYWAASKIGLLNVGLLSAAMMVVASLMLIPEIKHGRRGQSGQ